MRKSTTKTTEPQKEIVSNDLTNETEVKENGGKMPLMTPSMKMREIINALPPKEGYNRIVIDDINEDTAKLVYDLWDLKVQFIVAGQDPLTLNPLNTAIINRSGSMGRWRVVTYAQSLLEPAEIFIMYKKVSDVNLPVKQTIHYSDL